MIEHPLASGTDPDRPVGWRDGQPVSLRRLLQAGNALAARLPRNGHCINLCEDRLNFLAGFAAALIARCTTVLPPNRAPGVLADLERLHAGAVVLADHDDALHAGGTRLEAHDWPGAGMAAECAPIPAAHAAAVLYTSGSTGAPQPHAKSWGSLVRAARAAQARIGLPAGTALLGAVPPQHMWGFEMTVMLTLQAGCAADAGCPLLPADIGAALARLPQPRWLVATPLHLQACLSTGQPMAALGGVLCATARLEAELARAAERSWQAPLWEIYGSTETGALATRRTALETEFTTMEGIGLHPLPDHAAEARGGQLDGPVSLNDLLELGSSTRFTLHGRSADMVKVAGKRASLAALAAELGRVPGVQDGVFWLRDAPGEPRLAAFAVAPGIAVAEILTQLRRRIDPVFLPRPLLLVPELPRERTGKLSREALNELIARHGQAAVQPGGPARWLRVPHSHPALPHHFPGDPIVPGVWLLSLIEGAARERFGAALQVRGVPDARFRRALRPGEAYRIELTRIAPDRLEFVVEAPQARIADGTLIVQGAP